ncbi:hypothetical protein DPMN_110125 [Dreissena polymorpha]|uniref:Uncharacterized protein n=1 Tax=Dreissena polymorpha TaxID=45954 RepID=A0A9D4J8G5_DREPO|nr:hypothetical protein DPMN_152556 [Dreissena polymorpha]KAH3836750.1 hypothetical protein DPMN_110125 [Dreissena polymorpha]
MIHKPVKSATLTSLDTGMSDDELIAASQEIENALQSIHNYEQITASTSTSVSPSKVPTGPGVQTLDLPVTHSPGGTLNVCLVVYV